MIYSAADLYARLTELDSDDTTEFTLADDVSESDVETWLDNQDVDSLKTDADGKIERETVTDLSEPKDIGGRDMSVGKVIESHNDDPKKAEAAYVMRADRTFVQYFKRGVGEKQPITEENVQSELDSHVSEMVNRAVNAELLERAKAEFGT